MTTPVSGPSKEIQNTTALIESILPKIEPGLVEKHIQKLQDYKTRYANRGDKCFQAADYIHSVFEQNGLATSYDDFLVGAYKMRNIIGEITGQTSPDEIFVICAHYDSITGGNSWTDAPGADDNGSGTAAVMALAEILSDYEFNCTIRFIAFGAEEVGLKGSYHYVNDLFVNGETVAGVLDLDMIANNPTGTTVELYWGSGSIVFPYNLINETVNTTLAYPDEIGLQIFQAGASGGSDHQPFSRFFESVMLIESDFSPYYHSTSDTLDKLNMTYCAQVTRITAGTIAKMAQIIPGDMSPPALTWGFPPEGAYAPAFPAISIEAVDPGQLNITSLSMLVNGLPVSPVLTPISQGYNVSHVPGIPFSDGQTVNVSFSVRDMAGHVSNRSWQFIVDAVAPMPPTNLTISKSRSGPVKQGLVIDIGTGFDARNAKGPSVIFKDGLYRMWYAAQNTTYWHVCYATSPDGISWTKHGIVLYRGIVGDPDSNFASYPTVIYDGEYKMWYSGFNGTNVCIMYANSTDGIAWTKRGIAVGIGAPGSMDETYAYLPCVIKTGEYKMWYSGFDGLQHRILYANSSDGITWTKHVPDLTPSGPGIMYGDGLVWSPKVAFFDGQYHMYYTRYDGTSYRTMYANSTEGLTWSDRGLAIDTDPLDDYDSYGADMCAILPEGGMVKIWYSGFNGAGWRILYANLTPADFKTDLTIEWTPSTSQDIVKYEVFRESRPSAFEYPLERSFPEFYQPPAGITRWTFETACVSNASVYGPVAGSDPPSFYLADDNIKNITLYIEQDDGAWFRLEEGASFGIDVNLGYVEIYSADFIPGCTVFAYYNHSAGRALSTTASMITDAGAGSSYLSYYYVVRAVDRAGNMAQCTEIVGKIGLDLWSTWNLVSAPLVSGPIPVEEALDGLDWTAARTWEPARWPHQWTLNMPGRAEGTNSLENITESSGIWVKIADVGTFVTCGQVANVSTNLKAGWNLVSYPYLEMMTVSQALEGVPWDRVEIFADWEPNMLAELTGADILVPGWGMWVHVTSDTVWTAVNLP